VNQLPTGHLVARRLVFIVLVTVLAIGAIWFIAAKVATGDAGVWFGYFRYWQEDVFYSLYYALKWPWE
jgi:hypothetical protein